jgi:hypothetical protein
MQPMQPEFPGDEEPAPELPGDDGTGFGSTNPKTDELLGNDWQNQMGELLDSEVPGNIGEFWAGIGLSDDPKVEQQPVKSQ